MVTPTMFVLEQFLNFPERSHKPVSFMYSEGSGYKAGSQAEHSSRYILGYLFPREIFPCLPYSSFFEATLKATTSL